jgi:menaquinol-cytochrome c reductase iron-sulfur subunit
MTEAGHCAQQAPLVCFDVFMAAVNPNKNEHAHSHCGCGTSEPVGRRSFFKGAATIVLGTAAIIAPIGAAISVMLDPLKRKAKAQGNMVRVASLSSVPADGVPRKFAVISSRTDAWNKFPNTPIGAVYLRRTDEKNVEAFNVVCPHAGGFIDYNTENKCFLCPLHNSSFALDGSIKDPKSPSPRPMDALKVEVRDGEIWVAFQNFLAGTREKIPA